MQLYYFFFGKRHWVADAVGANVIKSQESEFKI